VIVCEQHWLLALLCLCSTLRCLWFCLWLPPPDFWAIHTHWQFEHLAQESHFQLKQAKVTTVIRTPRTLACKIIISSSSSSNNTNYKSNDYRNKSNKYMPTLTQLKYIPYYLTKEIVLFASSTQREQQQRGVQIWTRLFESRKRAREREREKWDIYGSEILKQQQKYKWVVRVSVIVFVPAFQIKKFKETRKKNATKTTTAIGASLQCSSKLSRESVLC